MTSGLRLAGDSILSPIDTLSLSSPEYHTSLMESMEVPEIFCNVFKYSSSLKPMALAIS
jgi:hypothetical protein